MTIPIKKADDVVHIALSDQERDTGDLTKVHLYDAVDAFNNDGVVVLDNAVPVEVIDKLNERMTNDTHLLLKRNEKLAWGQGKGHGNLFVAPPLEKEYLFPEIYANKPATKVITQILGPRPQIHFLGSNTALPKEGVRQPVHKDCRFLHPAANYNVVLNFNLIDVSPESGATEFWLGTSRATKNTDWVEPGNSHILPANVEERRKVRPPIQPTVKRGGIMLRDQRTWHAGMTNNGNVPRVMLGIAHFAEWFGNGNRIKMPKSIKPVIENLERVNDTVYCTEWVDDDKFHYLDDNHAFGFHSEIHPEYFKPFQQFADDRLKRIGVHE